MLLLSSRLLTKIASVLLYFTLGYQFCQNSFIQPIARTPAPTDSFTIVIHVAIACAVVFRSVIVVLEKRNSMNKLDYVKRLQRKQMLLLNDPNDASGPLLFGKGGQHSSSTGGADGVDEIELAPSIRTPGNNNRKHYEYAYENVLKLNFLVLSCSHFWICN